MLTQKMAEVEIRQCQFAICFRSFVLTELFFRIAKTKQADDERMKPLYVLLERSGEVCCDADRDNEIQAGRYIRMMQDLEKEAQLIQMIDQRLDQELHDMKARQDSEIEWLMKNRGEAKVFGDDMENAHSL